MFISHDPFSGRAKSNSRQTINTFIAANASIKRHGRRGNPVVGTTTEVTLSLDWLHERPIIISRGQEGKEGEESETGPCADNDGESITDIVAVHGKGRSTSHRAKAKRLVRTTKLLGCEAVELPVSGGYDYPVPKKKYYPSLLFQSQSPHPQTIQSGQKPDVPAS